MLAVKTARKIILANPGSPEAKTLSTLVIALEAERDFPLSQLYTLTYPHFELALEILREWRLDQYYSSKGRLLDVSMHATELGSQAG